MDVAVGIGRLDEVRVAELKPMTIEDMKAVISEMLKFSCDVDEKAWELWNDRFETN